MAKGKASAENHDQDDTMERMNKALKKMLDTPPETHEEMVRRRRSKAQKKSR